jgi:hypothetical protein
MGRLYFSQRVPDLRLHNRIDILGMEPKYIDIGYSVFLIAAKFITGNKVARFCIVMKSWRQAGFHARKFED